jgi:hypothetical protein
VVPPAELPAEPALAELPADPLAPKEIARPSIERNGVDARIPARAPE